MYSQNRTITKLGAPDRIYTEEDGLISNSCYGLTQDLDGFIWIYSENGISKFDGHTFKNFTTADGLSSNNVWMISVDSMNRKWIHTDEKRLDYILDDKIYEGVVIPNIRVTLLVPISKYLTRSNEPFRSEDLIIEDSISNIYKYPMLKITSPLSAYFKVNEYLITLIKLGDTAIITNLKNCTTWKIGTFGEFLTPTFINGAIQLSRQNGIDVFMEENLLFSFDVNEKTKMNRGMLDKNNNIWVATKYNGINFYSSVKNINIKSNFIHNLSLESRIKFDNSFAYQSANDALYLYNVNMNSINMKYSPFSRPIC